MNAFIDNFDAQTLSMLHEQQQELLFNSIQSCTITTVETYNTYTKSKSSPQSFLYNADSILLLEDYLIKHIKRRIVEVKYSDKGHPTITKIKSFKALTSSNKEQIEYMNTCMYTIGYVFGQILAQTYGAKWVVHPRVQTRFLLELPSITVDPFQEPFNFVFNGKKCSLAVFFKAANPEHTKLQKQAGALLYDALAAHNIDEDTAEIQACMNSNGLGVSHFKVSTKCECYIFSLIDDPIAGLTIKFVPPHDHLH